MDDSGQDLAPLIRRSAAALGLVVLSVVVGFWLLGHPGAFLADADSELPVKLWAHRPLWTQAGWLGGAVAVLSWPQPGLLNNAELATTAWFAARRPLMGEAFAWNGGNFCTLLATEDPPPVFGLQARDPRRFHSDLRALRDDGFVGIVLNPTQYKSAAHADAAGRLLSALGRPIVAGDQRIYRLNPAGAVSTRP